MTFLIFKDNTLAELFVRNHDMSNNMPNIAWIQGLLDFLKLPYPDEINVQTFGMCVGKEIIGLYLIEILLKHTLYKFNIEYNKTHDIYKLFKSLPEQQQRKAEEKYTELINGELKQKKIEKSIYSAIKNLGQNPITDARYFWDMSKGYTFSPNQIIAILSVLLFSFAVNS